MKTLLRLFCRNGAAGAVVLALLGLSSPSATASVLSIPSGLTVAPGGSISAPVNLSGGAVVASSGVSLGGGYNITGFTFDVTFNPSVVNFVSVSQGSGLGSDTFNLSTSVISNNGTVEEIRVLGFDNNPNGVAYNGTGPADLVNLNFTAVGSAGQSSALDAITTTTRSVTDQNNNQQVPPGTNIPGSVIITAAVPEPSQIMLLGELAAIGSGTLVWTRRRRKTASC